MDYENFTERSQGFIQSAQVAALGKRHQMLLPEHLLKVLLDDREGLCAMERNRLARMALAVAFLAAMATLGQGGTAVRSSNCHSPGR